LSLSGLEPKATDLLTSRSNCRLRWLIACVLLIAISAVNAATATNRLAEIRARGALNCGIWPHVPGFAVKHDETYVGFEVDICRAVAAAVLGDATKVRFIALAHIDEFDRRDDIDLVIRRLTWTLNREVATGMTFGPIIFYDGQGFLAPKSSQLKSISQLTGKRVCVINMERHPEILFNFSKDRGRDLQLVLVEDDKQAEEALRRDRCEAYSGDVSWLAAARASFVDGLSRYEILPELISKEPLAPLMRRADAELVQVVRWTILAMIEAEELGIDSHTIEASQPRSSRVREFLNIHPGAAVALGPGHWSRAIIAGVGNYGEVFDHNLGKDSSIQLERGLNRLWNDGGLMYAPPLDR
jgi:general L-amino acid transport system substrate-binding protein